MVEVRTSLLPPLLMIVDLPPPAHSSTQFSSNWNPTSIKSRLDSVGPSLGPLVYGSEVLDQARKRGERTVLRSKICTIGTSLFISNVDYYREMKETYYREYQRQSTSRIRARPRTSSPLGPLPTSHLDLPVYHLTTVGRGYGTVVPPRTSLELRWKTRRGTYGSRLSKPGEREIRK